MKPDDIPQWAWDEAGRVFCELLSIPSEVYQEESWSLDQEHIARALLEAERRGMERAAEVAEKHASPGQMWERDEMTTAKLATGYAAQDISAAIRAAAKEIEP